MIRVRARGDEPLEQLLKRFKKICEKEGLTKEIKRTSYYEKPSEAKRRKMRQMVKKEIKRLTIKDKVFRRKR
ncbi:MAG: 30S ribosomal protein S21 [Planctomycetota bacterium]